MKIRKIKNRISQKLRDNHGTTLVEMIVSFALLSIFLMCAAMIISTISMMYYNIKGEIYSREVSDIILEKITSELDGAIYYDYESDNPIITDGNSTITLCDKTNTKVSLKMDTSELKNGLVVNYHEIEYRQNGFLSKKNSRKATDWYFDKNMYNGFEIKELKFYGGGTGSMSSYGGNIVLVQLKIQSKKYGEYTYNKYVKMYNLPDNYVWK